MSSGLARLPLADVDSAWLRMDDPTNLMVVTGVVVLDRPVPFARVRDVVGSRLARFPRFRQRVVDDAIVGTAHWEEDEGFSLDHHFVEAPLPGDVDEAGLQAFVSGLMSQPFDPRHPLWQAHFVPHYQGGCALVMRVHHCIGDGLALIYVMLAMADEGPGPAPAAVAHDHAEDENTWEAVARSLGQAIGAALHVPAIVLREINAFLNDPHRVGETVGSVKTGVGALGKLLLIPPDPHTRFKGPLGPAKRVAWSDAVPIETLKRIGRATGSTINDVLMASLAGALRRYLIDRGDVLPDSLEVRGIVPVNLRRLEEAHLLGNQFGLVFLPLPLGLEDPLDRLFAVRKQMNGIKHTPEAYLAFQILRGLGLVPKQLFDLVVTVFGMKATAVVTNVIGPRQRIRFLGEPMRQAMFWVPCAGRLGLGVSLLSYDRQVWLGVQSDAALIPDPGALLAGFAGEIEQFLELERLARES